jgi:hypothetical protein
MKQWIKGIAVALALAFGAPAWAASGVHRHDGFFLRLEPGFAYLSSSGDGAFDGVPAELTFKGGAGHFGVAVGGAVKENLILAGHLFGTNATDPELDVEGVGDFDTDDVDFALVGIGPQLTWYVMPANVYLSGTLALTRLTIDGDFADDESDWGIGGRFAIGKEWWVSHNWGLGVAGHVALSTNEWNDDDVTTWTTGVTFSATFN